MTWYRLPARWVLVLLAMALLTGLAPAGLSFAVQAPAIQIDGALRPSPSALAAAPEGHQPLNEAPPGQPLAPTPRAEPATAGVTTVASDTPGVALAFTKTADPAEVRPGHAVTYTLSVTNAGPAQATHLVISDALPAGLVYVPGSAGSGQYDPTARHLTWSLAELDIGAEATFRFQARAVPAAPNPILNTAEVSSPDLVNRPTASASVHVLHAAEWVVLPDAATQLVAPGGRVTLEVPAGAVAQSARFKYRSLAARPLTSGRTGLALQFEFTALPVAAGEPITQFQKPLRLIVDLTDLVDVDALQPGESLFVGYQDAATGQWMPLPLIEYQPGPVLTVELDHFTLLGAGTAQEYESGWVLAFNAPQVSLFDGGFTYRYPIEAPPGRGGLQPAVNLSYSSRRVDGVLSWIQTDWAGLGWSVDQVEITRKITPNLGCGNPCWRDGWSAYENAFTLLFNGTGYKLTPESPDQYYGRYHTENESFLYIERRNKFNGHTNIPNLTKEYWIIRAKDGTEYRLGYTTTSEQVVRTMHWYAAGCSGCTWQNGQPPENGEYAGEEPNTAAFRWRVDQIADRDDNKITFGYQEESDSLRDNASYLEEVCYDPVVLSGGAERCGSRVIFDHGPRGETGDPVTDWLSGDATDFIFHQRDYLRGIQVQFWNLPDGRYDTVREYDLAYVGDDRSDPPPQTRLLDSITVRGRDGRELPATTFVYEDKPNKGGCGGCSDLWDIDSFDYDRLIEIHNGYGGAGAAQYDTPDDDVIDGSHTRAYNYRTVRRQTLDRGTVVSQVAYAYPTPNADRCYDNDDDRVCDVIEPSAGTGGQFIGYKTVTETLKAADGTPVAVIEHDFWLKNKTGPTFALGREIETRVIDPAGPTPLRTVQRTYTDDTAGRPVGVHFIRLDQVDTYASDTTAPHTRTEYSYDAYGNITRITEHGNVNVTGDERTSHYRYYPKDDGTIYIVDRVARASVYAGLHPTDDDDPTTLKARTRYHYDLLDPADPWSDPQAWTDPPAQGRLTQVDAWHGGPTGNDDGEFDVTGYRYDDWGNPIRVTDPLSRTTTTDYDALFHTYPVTRTNALGHATLTQYYGVNGAPATGSGAHFGEVESVTNANGAATRYTYDAFGRLTSVRRPGDESGWPTVTFAYTDTVQPFQVQVDRRQDASTVRTSYRFYDGLGRLIETKTPLPGNQQAVQHTTYDAQGLVAETYIPYTDTLSTDYVLLDTTKPRTAYTYDALGRLEVQTHPDGRTGQTGYDGWRTTVVDENGHQTVHERDGFGRLATVEEYEGTGPYTLYATTTYAYNVLDALSEVWDAAGNHTDIEYDPLGRKTRMVDPDMGEWTYAYDEAGNLTQQTDARGCTTDFSYDGLNRLRGKTYSGPALCGSTPAVSYSYDYGAYGKGQRTGMANGSDSTRWGYDARGRVVTETQRIGALGTYTTTFSYDSQDQVVSTTYPDDEVVTTSYNIAGQPATLSSSLEAGDLGAMTYNAQGQPKTLQYGNALVTHFGYYGYNHYTIGDGDDAPDQSWANGHVGRLWKLCTVPAGVVCDQAGSPNSVLDLRYGYDEVGNILNLRDRTGGGDELQTFTYDDLDRLTGTSGVYSETYEYVGDEGKIGNPTFKTGVGSYTYDASVSGCTPGTLATKPHAVAQAGSDSFGYDCNGNMTGRAGDTLAFDAENRLRSVTTAGQTVTFTYDGDGRRVLRDTSTGTVAYVGPHYELQFDKQPMVEDLDDDCQVTVIDVMRVAARWGAAGGPEDVNGSGIVGVADIQQVAGQWRETCHVLAETVKYYSLGGQRIAMRQVPAGQAGTLYYLFTDHLGSTSVSYNTANGQTQTLRYYPWGGVRAGDIPTDRRFTGQRWDATIGLYDYQARYYDAGLGRFVQPDTVVPEPGNPQALNRYTYVYNNPLRYTDPSGHTVPPGTFRQWTIKLPSWAQSGVMQRALSVGCFFLSCHVDAEQGVLRGPTPEEQITTAIQPMPLSVAGGAAGHLADDVVDDIVRTGLKKVEQWVLPGFEDLIFRVEQAIRSEIRPAGKLLGRRIPDTEVHHLLERRFAERFGLDPNDMPAVRLDKTFHQQEVTARLFSELPTNPRRSFTAQDVWNAYQRVYGPEGLNRLDWLEAVWPYFEKLGVAR